MTIKKQTSELNNFDSEMERRFQEETTRIRSEDKAVLDRIADHQDIEEPGVLDGIKRKWVGVGAVAASAALLTGIGVGKTTLGEGSHNSPNIPAMQERAKENQQKNLEHSNQTGEPLISNRQ